MEKTGEKETNIQVVVRCRERNEREEKENSPIVVFTGLDARGREVQLRTSPLDKIPNKSFFFDRVFGPDANQQLIYQEIVVPILEEVLMGYNCSILAYGQTGTGKTYTMEGDLGDMDGEVADHAGIIPRVLNNLFNILERDKAEYSVRVSFVELYNEELKDLLSPTEDTRKLKIFEDAAKKGVVLQGVEEVLVKNWSDGIRALRQGSHKRQVAATKCNENSSRSHCVFAITCHIRETTDNGEDLLKVGKLNLVDLAGSENIGRSGAENKRAREAGVINQGLLTLGRVINALVEHSPHVPYRDSKLTRLLQDSLGGRTKTCIIATISPAKVNLDESFSTLDYANRAKNIRNKPAVNQLLTKKALIKDYEDEIARLKSNLQAAWDKSGIFLSKDNYLSLVNDNQSLKNRIEELQITVRTQEEMREKDRRVIEAYKTSQRSMALDFKAKAGEFKTVQASFSQSAQVLMSTFMEEKAKELADGQKYVEDNLNEFVKLTQALLEGAVEMSDSAKQSFADITRQFIEFRTTISSKYHDQLAASEKLIQNLREELKRHFDKISAVHKQTDTDISVIVETAEIHIDTINSSITSIKNNANDHAQEVIKRREEEVTRLEEVTEEKRLMMESIQEEIISRMKALIMDLTQRATETDRETCTNMQKIIKQDLDDMQKFNQSNEERFGELIQSNVRHREKLLQQVASTNDNFTEIESQADKLFPKVDSVDSNVKHYVEAFDVTATNAMCTMDSAVLDGESKLSETSDSHCQTIDNLGNSVKENCIHIQTRFEKIRNDLKNNSHDAIKMVQENDCIIDSFSNEAATLVENMRVDMERLAAGKFEVNNDDTMSDTTDMTVMTVENRPESSASVLTEVNGDCRKRTRSQMPVRKKRHKVV